VNRLKYRLGLIRPLLLPLILYIGALTLVAEGLDLLGKSPWRYALVLLPLVPGIFIAAGVIKAWRKLEELELKIIQDSMGIAFLLTLLLSLCLGLLETAGLPQVNSMYLGLFMACTWLIGKLILNGKYR